MADPLLPTHASSPLLHLTHPPPQVLKRKHTKAVPLQHSSFSSLPLTFSLRILHQPMSPLKYSRPLLSVKPSAKHKTQSPISKITFMPMTPPNLSPDLTCQQFYSHTLYCLLGSSNSDVYQHLCFSQRSLVSYIPCTPCHIPATSMVFLQLYPSLPTEMLTSLQS